MSATRHRQAVAAEDLPEEHIPDARPARKRTLARIILEAAL
jgi:hypothetical protein